MGKLPLEMEVVYLRLYKLLALVTALGCLSATTAFAAPVQEEIKDKVIVQGKCADFDKDPVKALECRKAKVQSMLKAGEITKEEANEITARLDAKIAKIKEFNKLTLPQKRAKLVEDFKASIDNKVKEGRLTKEGAAEITRKFNEKVEKWDGNGLPKMHSKGFKHGKDHMKDENPMKDKGHMKDKPINP